MKNIKFLFALVISVSLFLAGCGYTTSSLMASGPKTVYIDNFVNKIKFTEEPSDRRMYVAYRSGMELDITREVINRFILDGNLKVMPKDESSLILEGELIDFIKDALRYDTNDNVVEYRIRIAVNIKLIDAKTGEIIWEEPNFTGESIYKTKGQYATSEETAVQDAEKDLGIRIVERTVESW